MPSIKCAQCGLVNFSHAESCKRCHAALNAVHGAAEPSLSPVVGAWRDRRWLVTQLSVPLAPRCIKCSESADVTYKPVSLKVYSAWSLLTQLAGVRVFRMIPVDIPLCRRHRSGLDKVAIGLVVAGLAGCILGFALLSMYSSMLPIVIFSVGFFVMAAGFIFSVVRSCEVSAWRFKDPYIWLGGVHRSYLDGLPEWSKRQAR